MTLALTSAVLLTTAEPNVPSHPEPGLTRLTIHRGIAKSLHFIRRAEERGLREEVLEFILTFGTEWRRARATHLTVVERDLPQGVLGSAMAGKAKDWIVLISDDDVPITCYRRAGAVRFLSRKDKRCWSEDQITERRQKRSR